MASVKFQSRTREKTSAGVVTVLTYQGSYDEMLQAQKATAVPSYSQEYGELRKTTLRQSSPELWELTYEFTTDHSGSGVVSRPSKKIGDTTCSCSAVCQQIPLEAHPNYKANWDHYLAAAPGVTAIPAWWSTATDCIITADADIQKYAWIKSPSEVPVTNQQRWKLLKKPQIPGVSCYDKAAYTVTEVTNCRSEKDAGKVIKGKANKVGYPPSFADVVTGNWKVDSVMVRFSGEMWQAEIVWTASGDRNGWNPKLYGT